ncbi:DUF4174 domain-containing protein [Paracoccus aurantiacus]|uniref:DUF4174 domain-containing protein n=1 Tax=Paracoccus aurantiacus TaxID=2599412 RepID=A0A5C6S9W1_9RHOB|nr:DUF4174 domain-containing protein [Paracoccus aurantiacus]TXB70852.1 DUF4174 domain-containing protein [Paracoccus aurantiacus]
MKNALTITLIFISVAAMGPGREMQAPSRVNPPSPAEVDAMQAARNAENAPPAAVSDSTLHIVEATEVTPDSLLWQARPVVVFADTAADPAFLTQIRSLQGLPAPLIERDVIVITDTDPAAASEWRRNLHPRGFSLVIIDKDGQVKQRKPVPWSVREISRAIDKFPLRREEIGRAGLGP